MFEFEKKNILMHQQRYPLFYPKNNVFIISAVSIQVYT